MMTTIIDPSDQEYGSGNLSEALRRCRGVFGGAELCSDPVVADSLGWYYP